MGIIKEGKVSGCLPTNDVFAVHYPAYPSSLERAVETLGGTEAISKARSSQSNKLELHFRPEDPYSHPAFGELHACNKFLLRISKNRVGNSQDAVLRNKVSQAETLPAATDVQNQVPEETEDHLSADLVARIPEAYHFNGMADYQHVLAVHADAARQKKRNWAEFEKGGLMDVDQEDLMILLPQVFSLKDVPEKVVLKPSFSSKKKQESVVQHHWERDIEPSFALDFNIKEIPKKVNWEKYINQGSEQWEWQKTVCELFDERPIWVRSALSERLLDKGLEVGENQLKMLLFRAAYSFSNGPFLKFLIRKGYDPRKDPESRIYQRTEFRVPPSLQSYRETNVSPASRLKQRWDDMCAFRVFPYKYQTSFQLFELADDFIQDEIRKPPTQATCNLATGWFSSIVVDTLRLCVAVRFLSVYPKAGVESLLKSVSNRFEKSKRLCMFPKDLKVNEEGEQANREAIEDQDKEPNVDEEYVEEVEDEEDEDDEIEDNIIEEDLDAYEALNLDGQEGNFSPHQHPYIDHENISRSYLQDLFGSFPFNGAGEDDPRDANHSDGEYQIYEQFSDGNCSDDDDY